MTTSVYVSYSWSADKETPIVDLLGESCRGYGLDFRRDIERIKYGDLIRSFMDEIGSAGNIIPVFSRKYFESEYCMYELLQIKQNGKFHSRIHPINLGDIRLDDEDLQLSLIDYWREKTESLREKLYSRDPASTRRLQERNTRRNAEIYASIDELMDYISDMYILPLESLQQQNFLPLLQRIQPKREDSSSKPRFHRQKDSAFLQEIRFEIRQILDRRVNLQKALLGESSKVLTNTSGDLVEDLCQADFRIASSRLLSPATKTCLSELSSLSAERKETWEDAKSLLAWLSLLLVDSEWMAQYEKSEMASGFSFEIMVKTSSAVEIVSCRCRQMQPKFRAKQNKPEVTGDDRIDFPKLDLDGWSEEQTLNKLLIEIWLRIFPEENRQSLSQDDLETLNENLAYYEQTKDYHYYVAVEEGNETALARAEFRMKLLEKLPSITLICLKSPSGKSSLLINEQSIAAAIRGFFTSPWAS